MESYFTYFNYLAENLKSGPGLPEETQHMQTFGSVSGEW